VGSPRFYRREGERFVEVALPGKRPSASVHDIQEDAEGRLWLATAPVLSIEPGGEVRSYGPADLLTRALLPRGPRQVWLGTQRGLMSLEEARLRQLTEAQGLFDDVVSKIVDDRRGHLWLCTRRGLVRMAHADLTAVAGGTLARLSFTRLGAGDGYDGDQCDPGEGNAGAGRTRDGRLFFAGARSVALIDPGRRVDAPAPRVLIERVASDGALFGEAQPTLPPGRRLLEIEYTATSLRAPERVLFRYRLAPFDDRWVEAGTRRVAYYTNLPGGEYRFEVEARSDDRSFSPQQAALAFEVSPLLHQRWGFRATLLAAALLIALGAHRLRVRQVEVRHAAILRERNRIAREIHDTLAQGLNGISLHLEAARSRVDGVSPAAESLQHARALVDASLEEARRAIWDLRAESLERAGVLPALGDLARRLAPKKPVRLRVVGRAREIPGRHHSALLRVGQEAITNALRHAEASEIAVELVYEPRAAELRVTDDGRGIAADHGDERGGHFGLAGIRERVEELGGELSIDTAPGRGTTIRARVPLPEEA
jgi:signal transduction histidine kinase